ncbi:MAG: hypothetical protein RLY86_2778 [Pseudomonadota bacterium]|jgi:nitric oxide dioxygenase
MTPEQISMVQHSFGTIALNKEAVAEMFYSRLFALDPALRPLFTGDMQAQGRKLMAALAVAVSHLRNPDVLLVPLREMGARHRGYGVDDRHYDTVATALIQTLEQGLGDSFTQEMRGAWVAAYSLVASVMKQAPARVAA